MRLSISLQWRWGGGERKRENDVFDELGLSADGAGESGHPRMPEARGECCENQHRWLGNMIFPAFR